MKKWLAIIIGLGLLVYLAQVYEAASCRDLVKDMTGSEAIEKYEECKKFQQYVYRYNSLNYNNYYSVVWQGWL